MDRLKEFIKYYKPHKKLFIIDMVCSFAISSLDLVFPIISRNFINDFIPNEKLDAIINFSVLLLILYVVRMFLQYVVSYWGHVMGTRMEADMRKDLFSHIQTLPFEYFDENKTGQIMSRLVGDLRDIGELAHHGPENLFLALVMLIGSFIALILT